MGDGVLASPIRVQSGNGAQGIGALGAHVFFDRIEKQYGNVMAVREVSLDIAPGEFVTLLGPSGSGKTTTLMMLAGFEIPTAGEIYVDTDPIAAVPPYRRNIGMVFQNYALFPHMTVGENIAFPLQMRKMSKSEIQQKTRDVLALVGLPGYEARYPRQLSGGQQQRVAVARALVFNPRVLLMDEPLGALDKQLRERLQLEIKALHDQLGVTIIYVTHDQEEATAVSDRIAVFDRGRLIQVGAPETIYAAPATLYVADFIGRANFLPATLAAPGRPDEGVVLADGTRLVPRRHFALADDEASVLSGADAAVAMLRPEHLSLAADAGDVACKVLRVEMLGGLVRYRVEAAISPRPIVVESTRPLPAIREGAAAWLSLAGDDAVVYHR